MGFTKTIAFNLFILAKPYPIWVCGKLCQFEKPYFSKIIPKNTLFSQKIDWRFRDCGKHTIFFHSFSTEKYLDINPLSKQSHFSRDLFVINGSVGSVGSVGRLINRSNNKFHSIQINPSPHTSQTSHTPHTSLLAKKYREKSDLNNSLFPISCSP